MFGLGAAALLLGGAGAIAIRDLRDTRLAQDWVQHTREVLETAAAATRILDRAESAQRGYLLADDTTALRPDARPGRSAIEALAAIEALRARTRDHATQQRRLDTLQRLVPSRLTRLEETVALARAGRRDEALAIVRTARGDAEADSIGAVLGRFVDEEQRLLRERMQWRETRQRTALRNTLLALGLASLTAGGSVLLLGRVLRRQASQRDRLRDALADTEASEARYRMLFVALPRPAWVYDRDTLRFLAVNPAAVAQYGWTEEEFLARRITDIRPPEDAARVVESSLKAGDAPLPVIQWRHCWKDGQVRDVVVTTHPLQYAGRAARLCVVDDITDRLEAERALRSRDARFRAAMQGMRDGFVVMRAVPGDGVVNDFELIELNASVANLLGVSASHLNTRSLRALLPRAVESGLLGVCAEVLASGHPFEAEHRTRDGRTAAEWVRLQIYPLDGEPGTLAVIVRDVTARKRAERRLHNEAHRDPLTGLLNRRGLEHAVERRLREAAATEREDALLYLDLDGFKPINDTHGHAEGDRALRTVADVLRRAMRAGDAIARLGGDEFVVYCATSGDGDAQRAAAHLVERVHRAFDAVESHAEGQPYMLRASVGCATVRTGDTLASLLSRADAALYAEKAARRGAARVR